MATTYETEKATYLQHLDEESSAGGGNDHALETTPLFSLSVRYATRAQDLEKDGGTSNCNERLLPQYGLLGFHVGDNPLIGAREPIMLNTRAPNSTFLCGSQGSGKSFTLSCILENCLLPDPKYGTLANPIPGVAFHYNVDDMLNTAEVASLCKRGIKVTVLVSHSNYRRLKEAYLKVKGPDDHLNVYPLLFKDEHLSIERMHKLMAFAENSENGVPLYVEVIHEMLRKMAINNERFDFATFRRALDNNETFAPGQRNMLNMRLNLLQSFLQNRAKAADRPTEDVFKVKPGSLTIVDMSDTFIDSSTACTLFDICLGLFKQNRPKDGLIVTLDEAHKYLNKSVGAANFTEHLLTTIRMQRHQATRVVIATQEPTISGSLLDLCPVSIVHRFSSPAWFEAIKDHLAGASNLTTDALNQKLLFDNIVSLGTGESFVFATSSFLCLEDGKEKMLATKVMKMKTRTKQGPDTGRSKMAGDEDNGDESDVVDSMNYWKVV
ncbi:hypothetical protein LTR37_005784 [Vermiconidia calcicola]|uniref:Uncharacterized protein n=1 Tax=Vermiconidia calcicola TaxID=1690605 RepID=A0ACC3NIF3_9PEZI|nr:hypothetical protein LTR37_005784 [Vermiconidia calcicola]